MAGHQPDKAQRALMIKSMSTDGLERWTKETQPHKVHPKRKYLTREMIRRQLKAMEAADQAYFARLKERYEKSKTK
jgi:hypothetical protein